MFDIEKINEKILSNMPQNLTDDMKMRYLYLNACKYLKKNVEFFYNPVKEITDNIYENFTNIDDGNVICRNVVYYFKELAKKVGLNCEIRKMSYDFESDYNHWALVYNGENSKKYLINPIPDFYRVQMGFKTKHFCCSDLAYGSDEIFDTMSEEYIRDMDGKLGYIIGNKYTDETLYDLSVALNLKIGKHIVKTSEYYQEYYLRLLELISNDAYSLEKKLAFMKKIDLEYEKNELLLIDSFNNRRLNKKLRNSIYGKAFNILKERGTFKEEKREGANVVSSFDITRLEEYQDEIFLYKFQYMIKAFSNLSQNLTGYIEHKMFFDELKNYMAFSTNEKERLHRHTVYTDEENKEYSLFYHIDLKNGGVIYSYYNPHNKEFEYDIKDVIGFMENKNLKILKNSTLNDVLLNQK